MGWSSATLRWNHHVRISICCTASQDCPYLHLHCIDMFLEICTVSYREVCNSPLCSTETLDMSHLVFISIILDSERVTKLACVFVSVWQGLAAGRTHSCPYAGVRRCFGHSNSQLTHDRSQMEGQVSNWESQSTSVAPPAFFLQAAGQPFWLEACLLSTARANTFSHVCFHWKHNCHVGYGFACTPLLCLGLQIQSQAHDRPAVYDRMRGLRLSTLSRLIELVP